MCLCSGEVLIVAVPMGTWIQSMWVVLALSALALSTTASTSPIPWVFQPSKEQ